MHGNTTWFSPIHLCPIFSCKAYLVMIKSLKDTVYRVEGVMPNIGCNPVHLINLTINCSK